MLRYSIAEAPNLQYLCRETGTYQAGRDSSKHSYQVSSQTDALQAADHTAGYGA